MARIIDAVVDVPQAPVAPSSPSEEGTTRTGTIRSRLWQRLGLLGIMLVSIFMNFYQLGTNGFGNLYYASGVRSMLDNWQNFFFVSYDPGGFVTVDKPPLGFWIQTLSAKLFGFTPFSVLLPEALAGVLSVFILYRLVRRHFGAVAGLLAALALAVSPISVVTNRNNTIDSILTLVLLLGAWAVMKAAETGKLRWLLLCATFIGLGFNIKMMQAYLVVPAYGLLYLLAAPRKFWTRIAHLALAVLLMLTISLSWAVAVDLIPASQRPYVGSSQNNSELSLALGYNGISRLLGMGGNSGGTAPQTSQSENSGTMPQPPSQDGSSSSSTNDTSGFTRGTNDGGSMNGGGGGAFNIGTAGLFRLFSEPLGEQIGWLLPFALLALVAIAWQKKLRFPLERQHQSLVLWGVWLLTMGIFFSVAGFFHEYYLTVMAPAVCALFGIGAVVMWRDYRATGWRGWLLPLAISVTIAVQVLLLSNYPAWSVWMTPLILGIGGVTVVALVVARLVPRIKAYQRVLAATLCAGILVLLLAPTVWGAIPVTTGYTAQIPAAGPSSQGGSGSSGMGGANSNVDTTLISYLEAHQGNAKYLVATISSQSADAIILATNEPVMTLGGFSGSDSILTTSQLSALVKSGTVRYFLISSGGMGGESSLTTWIKANCQVVSTSEWQSSSSSTASGSNNGTLYYYAG
jgi:4-amino-4-deoxy-L-arabinose transferase-like glycosyltransferase